MKTTLVVAVLVAGSLSNCKHSEPKPSESVSSSPFVAGELLVTTEEPTTPEQLQERLHVPGYRFTVDRLLFGTTFVVQVQTEAGGVVTEDQTLDAHDKLRAVPRLRSELNRISQPLR